MDTYIVYTMVTLGSTYNGKLTQSLKNFDLKSLYMKQSKMKREWFSITVLL